MSTINHTTLLRRLAPMAITVALLGAACDLAPSSGLDAGARPAAPTFDPAAEAEPGPSTPTDEPDAPPVEDDQTPTTTTPAGDDPATTGTTGGPEPDPGPADPAAPTQTDLGDLADQAIGDAPVAEPTGGGTSSNDRPTGRVADGRLVLDAHTLEEAVNLVYQGRGTHVADLLVQIGNVTPGSRLTVDYGDGTVADVGTVDAGRHVTVSHAFEPTLTFDHQEVWATVTEPDGTEHRDRLTFATRASFQLYYSPITVKALNDCDTFGKGDFHLSWDHGDGERSASFALGAGESARIGGFAGPGGRVVHDQEVPFELNLSEEDPWGAWFFAPWKWDGFTFRGSGSYSFRPVRQGGDHRYTVTNSSSTDEGVDGDDDCATLVAFDVTLDMLDG